MGDTRQLAGEYVLGAPVAQQLAPLPALAPACRAGIGRPGAYTLPQPDSPSALIGRRPVIDHAAHIFRLVGMGCLPGLGGSTGGQRARAGERVVQKENGRQFLF